MARSPSKYLSETGKRLVRQLFIENRNIGENDLAIYTMHREDELFECVEYPSLYKLYMEVGDITEARFVELYLYDWEQWESLASSATYKSEIARWRQELKIRVVGELVDLLITDAHSKSKSAGASAKYLINKFSKAGRGKPATEIVPTTEETAENTTSEILKDKTRLGLLKVVGGSDA